MEANSVEANSDEGEKCILRGEAALIVAVLINSFGVVLMLYSGSGISDVPVCLHCRQGLRRAAVGEY